MQVASVSASILLRGVSSARSDVAGTGDEPDTGILKLQSQSLGLDRVREALANSADEAKSRAQRKLEQAKQELQALRTAGFPPEVIARMAAELARKVGAAASEFASAVATGGASDAGATASAGADTSTATATPSADTAAAASDAAPAGTLGDETATTSGSAQATADEGTDTSEADAAAHARKAYQDIIDDSPKSSSISSSDRQTMEEFKSVVQELKQILEKAMRDLRQKNDHSQSADAGTAEGSIETTVARLSTSASSSAVPTSIII
jgi:hypothetical protein